MASGDQDAQSHQVPLLESSPAAQPSLQALCTLLLAKTGEFVEAAGLNISLIVPMHSRCMSSVGRARILFDAVLSRLQSWSFSCKIGSRQTHSELQRLLKKATLDCEVIEKALLAFSVMCESTQSSAFSPRLVLISLAHANLLASDFDYDISALNLLKFPVATLDSGALSRASVVWSEPVCGTTSELSGRALTRIVKGATGITRNIITVHPRVSSGLYAEYVVSRDIHLQITDVTGSCLEVQTDVQEMEGGSFDVSFALTSTDTRGFYLRFMVASTLLAVPGAVRFLYDTEYGTELHGVYPISYGVKAGMAVSADCQWMAELYCNESELDLYQLQPTVELSAFMSPRACGQLGHVLPLHWVLGVCFAFDCTMLVSNSTNLISNVLRISLTGECLRVYEVDSAAAVDSYGDMFVLGTRTRVELRTFPSGDLMRRIAERGDEADHFHGFIMKISFTSDGRHVRLAERGPYCVSVYTVEGALVSRVAADFLEHAHDFVFANDDTVIVSSMEPENGNWIQVYAANDARLLKSWGTNGNAPGQFEGPCWLAVAGPHLYVVDENRLQVFQ